jgi:hemolysin activation/secretion protein
MAIIFRFFVIFALVSASVWAQETAPSPQPAPPVLRKLILADTEAKVLAMSADTGGSAQVVVKDVASLENPDLPTVVAPLLGQPITMEFLNFLANAIKQVAIKHDRIIHLVVPNQPAAELAAGILRVVVLPGTYRDVSFRGNRWFSAKLLESRLGIKPGEEISISRLDEAVNWTNSNPFRRVQVMLNQDNQAPGKADLIVGVEERLPLRLAFAFDDTGNAVIGKDHYTTVAQYANLFGLDHQLTYQFVTTDHSHVYQAHAVDYRIPLKWRHFLQASVMISKARPTFNSGLFSQDARNIAGSLRYTVPLKGGDSPVECYGLIDFKQSNNNLEYGGFQILNSQTDLFHVGTGVSVVNRNKEGAWMLGANLMASPGDINSRNTTEALAAARLNAKARYAYGSVSMQYLKHLAAGMDWVVKGYGQLATANMLGSEQFTVGGSSTVRGYEERIFAGEHGFSVTNELMLPAVGIKMPMLDKRRPPLEVKTSIFHDYAQASYHKRDASDIEMTPLSSMGGTLRLSLPPYFAASFDYGWQLNTTPIPQKVQRRGHVKVSLAF